MGLIAKIKSMFSNTLTLPKNNDGRLVVCANPNGIIKVGQALVVPDEYVAVIVTKGKICDIFPKGEYDLETGIMQKATRARKLMKPDKKGNFPKKFNGYIYFINLAEYKDKPFESCYGVLVKEKKLFKTTVGLKGSYSYKVTNPKKFLQVLTKEYFNLTGELPEKQLLLWAGETTDKFIQAKKLSFKYFLNVNDVLIEGLEEHLKKEFEEIGIEILDINLTECEFSKKIQKKIENGKLFIDNMSEYVTYENEKKDKLSKIAFEENQEMKLDINSVMAEPYEDNMFEDASKENIDANKNIETSSQCQTYAEFLQKNSEKVDKNSELFDFNVETLQDNYQNDTKNQFVEEDEINEIYNDDGEVITAEVIKFKKCANCGANNPKDSEKCFNCSQEFGKTCNVCGNKLKKDDFVCDKCGAIII